MPTSVASGLSWMYLSSFLQAISKIAVLAALARLLEPKDFGIVGIAFIFTNCAERIGQVGVGPALVQRAELSDADISAGMLLSVISGILIAAVLFFGAPLVSLFFSEPAVVDVLRVLGIGFVIDGFGVVSDSLLQRRLRFKSIMMCENISYVVGAAGVGITLAFMGFGVWSLVYSSIAMKVIRLCLLLAMEPVSVGAALSWTACKSLLERGVGFSLGKILTFMSLQGDNFVVGRLLGTEILGMYTRAYQLMALPAMYLGQVLERVLFPTMAKEQRNTDRLRQLFSSSLEVMTIFALPASIVMFLLAEEIILVLFGAKWSDVVPLLEILSLGVFFRTAYKCSDTLARSLGAVYRHAARQTVYTVLVVGGSWLGAEFWGLHGVGAAVVLAVAVNYVLMTKLSAEFLGLSFVQVAKPHLPGIWISVWVAVALVLLMPEVRAAFDHPAARLMAGLILAFVQAVLAHCVAPAALRSQTLLMIAARIPLERLGSFGRWSKYALAAR